MKNARIVATSNHSGVPHRTPAARRSLSGKRLGASAGVFPAASPIRFSQKPPGFPPSPDAQTTRKSTHGHHRPFVRQAPSWTHSIALQWVVCVGLLLGSVLPGCGGCGDEKPACTGNSCGEQVCDGGMCKTASLQGVPASARACEALLELPDGATWTANFGEGVKGTAVAEGPRVAIAFLRESDSPFGADAVAVDLFAKEGNALSPNVTKSSCFDAEGEEIEDVALSLGQ